MTLALGDSLPEFSFVATGGVTDETTDIASGIVVLYFYPRDDTPGCTQEGLDFATLHSQFRACESAVFGISRDTLAKHEKFKSKMNFPFELIADPEEQICNLFGVMRDKNMYGKKVRGIDRSTFIFKNGILMQQWRTVKVPNHAAEVLSCVTAIVSGNYCR